MARKTAGSLKDITTTGPSAEMGIGGFAGALKAYQDGTAEVRGLLLGEVATIFECNFCRSVFRSIDLFVEHKRLYCGSKFSVAANEAAQAQSSSHASTKQKRTEEQKVFDVQDYISTCLAEYQKHLPTDRVLFEPGLADLPQPVTSQSTWPRKCTSQTTSKPDNVTTGSSKVKGREEDRRLNRSSSSASKGDECPKAQRTPTLGQVHSRREREVPDLRGRRRVRNVGGPTTPSSSAGSSVLTEAQKSTQSTEVHETVSLPKAGELLLHRTGTARDAALAWSAASIAVSKAPERQPSVAKSISADRASGGGEDARHLETKQHALTTPIDAFKKQPGSEEARVSPSAVAGAKDVQLPPPHTAQARSAPKSTYLSALVGAMNKRSRSASSATKPSVAEPQAKKLKGAQDSAHAIDSVEISLADDSLSPSKFGAETENDDSAKATDSSNSAKNASEIMPDADGLGLVNGSGKYALPNMLQKPNIDAENAVPASFASSTNNSTTAGSEEASPVKRSVRSGPLLDSQLPQKRVADPFRTIVPTVPGGYMSRIKEEKAASSSKTDAISQTPGGTRNVTHAMTPSSGADSEKRSESEERSVTMPEPSTSHRCGSKADAVANLLVASNASLLQVEQEDVNFKKVPVVLSEAECDLLFSRLHRLSENSNAYKCGECGEISPSISYGRAHMMSHMRVVRLICSLCDAGAFFCGDMRVHLMDRHCANLRLAPKGYVLPGNAVPCMDAYKADKLTRLVDPTKKGHAFLTPGKIVSTKSHKPYKPDSEVEARILGKTPITRSKSLKPSPVQLPVVPVDVFRFPLKPGQFHQDRSS